MASLRAVLYGAIGVAIALVAVERPVWAIGEPITDVRILDNQRTEESTVRSIAGINIGDTLQSDTLDMVRERLNTSGLFADVNVWWEPHGAGVRVNISIKDKFPWAPVPTASWSANNKSIGVVFVHGNLFGHGKQMLIGARYAQIDSGAALAYRDPSLFGSWIYWQIQGVIQRQVIPEYDSYGPYATLANPLEFRETRLWSYGFEPQIGIAWFRRVRTQVAWHRETFNYFNDAPCDSCYPPVATSGSDLPSSPDVRLFPSTRPGTVGIGKVGLTFDFRAREFAVMTGEALSGSVDYASPAFGSDFTFWRAGASWEQGIRFFRSHNLIYGAGGVVGSNLPFWNENTAGGSNLRGYLGQQFRGDTQLWGKIEYHFPLFSIGPLDFRALGFYDGSAIWFRNLPTNYPVTDAYQMYYQRQTSDGRTFPAFLQSGFSWDKSVHNDVGVGLRFFLRSVAVPLVGVDFGYGIESNNWNFIIVVGA
ncbi:MAG TPA: BamA/TamA family outer membrane protein [Polyangia bacterium]|nr:BamA/TamA family outer membrane protein [Polyangia bacterium]